MKIWRALNNFCTPNKIHFNANHEQTGLYEWQSVQHYSTPAATGFIFIFPERGYNSLLVEACKGWAPKTNECKCFNLNELRQPHSKWEETDSLRIIPTFKSKAWNYCVSPQYMSWTWEWEKVIKEMQGRWVAYFSQTLFFPPSQLKPSDSGTSHLLWLFLPSPDQSASQQHDFDRKT